MHFRRLKRPKSVYESVCPYYKQLYTLRKLVLVLANDYEKLSLLYTQQYFLRKRIATDDGTSHSSTDHTSDEAVIQNEMQPVLKGFTLNYIGNKIIGLIPQTYHFPSKQDVGIVQVIGPGEISNGILYAEEQLAEFLSQHQLCRTYSVYHYIRYDSKESYKEFVHRLPAKLIDNHFRCGNTRKVQSVFVLPVSYFKRHLPHAELYSLPVRLYYVNIALKLLKPNGDLYFVYTPVHYEASYQLLYIISTYFETYEFIESQTHFTDYSFIKYTGFKGVEHTRKLHAVYRSYMALDATLGEQSIQNPYEEDNVIFDFGVDIPPFFREHVNQENASFINKIKAFIDKCKYIHTLISNNPRKIKTIFEHQVKFAFEFARRYSLATTDVSDSVISKKHKRRLFPPSPHVDYNQLQLTHESTYSMTLPPESDKMSRLIQSRYPQVRTIADMNANVGGNTINFSKHFKQVYSIELDAPTAAMLSHNLKLYKCSNAVVRNESCVTSDVRADLYFYDPPWTGMYYQMHSVLDLYLDNKNIVDVLRTPFCLKAPSNYNVSRLLKKFRHIEVHQFKNYMFIMQIIDHRTSALSFNTTRRRVSKVVGTRGKHTRKT